jgi:hypothetical protein
MKMWFVKPLKIGVAGSRHGAALDVIVFGVACITTQMLIFPMSVDASKK